MKYSFLLLFIFIKISAQAQYSMAQFKQLYGLLGSWERDKNSGQSHEVWAKISDTKLKGISYKISANDTLKLEEVILELKKGQIHFTVHTEGQNQGKPVLFKLKNIKANTFIFENLQHDFPQRIQYTMPTADKLLASIEGKTQGKMQKVDFNFKKIPTVVSNFNKSLADSLGADNYGMKMYVLCMLKTGPSTEANKSKIDSLFAGHMKNIGRLADEGKLIVAGPLAKNDKNYRGIFILNVKTSAEASVLVATDPAVAAGLLACEYYPWYGSAALPMYLPYHAKVSKQSP